MGALLVYLLLLGFFALLVGGLLAGARVFLGPLLWLIRYLLTSFSASKPLSAAPAPKVLSSSQPSPFDELAPTQRGFAARDYETTVDGFRVVVRTQTIIARKDGSRAGFPWDRKDWQETDPVVESWTVIDVRDRIDPALMLQVQFGREEEVMGDEALAAALVDERMRNSVGPGDYLSIGGGLAGVCSSFALRDGRHSVLTQALAQLVRRLLAAHANQRAKDGRIDLPPMLEDNFELDRQPANQVRAVEVLLTRFADSGSAQRVRPKALCHPAPLVRFAAARLGGHDDLPIVLQVMEDPASIEGLRERALRHYLRLATAAEADVLIDRVLHLNREELRRIALRHVSALRRNSDVPRLIALEPETAGDTAVELAAVLGVIGDARAEDALLALFERGDPPLMIAAADALSNVGTPRSIPVLVPFSKPLSPADLQLACSTTVNLIRSRFAPAGEGALSMTATTAEGGELALSPEGGALSEPEE